MAVPNLLFAVTVEIQPIDTASTEYRRDAREPVRQAARSASIEIEAQVIWNTKDRPQSGRGGPQEKTIGYLVLRVEDLTAAGYEPRRGDRITAIPGYTGDWYLTSFEPAATRNGAHTLLMANFEDRSPTRGI